MSSCIAMTKSACVRPTSHYSELLISTPTAVAARGVGFFLSPFICFSRSISQKPMQVGSPNLIKKCSTMSFGNSLMLTSKGQMSRSRVTKTLPAWVFAFLWVLQASSSLSLWYAAAARVASACTALLVIHDSMRHCQQRIGPQIKLFESTGISEWQETDARTQTGGHIHGPLCCLIQHIQHDVTLSMSHHSSIVQTALPRRHRWTSHQITAG